jgi:Protein of unknown function (DUF2934)
MDQPNSQHDEARIRQRAYEIWMDEGTPSGRSEANWQQAKAELARADAPPQSLRRSAPMDAPDRVASTRRKAGR